MIVFQIILMQSWWPFKIPSRIIKSSTCPVLNIHASLLPQYRGPEPIIQQILHGERNGGVTIHKIDADWDTGDIVTQTKFGISDIDDNKTIFIKAGRAGIKSLRIIITQLMSNTLSFSKQDILSVTYYPLINIMDYIINESYSIGDVIRCYHAFRGAYPLVTFMNGKLIIINNFSFSDYRSTDNMGISLSDGFMIIKEYYPYELNPGK